MAQFSSAEFFEEVDELLGEVAVVRERLGVELEAVEVFVELNGRLDAFEDDGVAFFISDFKADEGCDGARCGNLCALEKLEAVEFAHGGAAAETAAEPVAEAGDGVEFQVIGFAVEFEAPDLTIGAVFDEFAGVGQIEECLFEAGGGHWWMIRAVQRIVPGRPWPGPRRPRPALSLLGLVLRAFSPAELILERRWVSRLPGRFFFCIRISCKRLGEYTESYRDILMPAPVLKGTRSQDVTLNGRIEDPRSQIATSSWVPVVDSICMADPYRYPP